MRSKAFHAFTSKLHYFDDDIEVIDVLRHCVVSGDLSDEKSQFAFTRIDPQQHNHLARRTNSDGARKLMISHLRTTLYVAYVKDIYEEVTNYLRTILAQASKKGLNSGRLIGEHSFQVDAKAILDLGDWNKVCEMVTASVFQKLEAERSTLSLLNKVSSKLDLNIDDEKIKNAIPYLECRHLLVHTDGIASPEFKKKYPHIKLKDKSKLDLNYDFISSMRSAVLELIQLYDASIIDKHLLLDSDLQP